MGLFDVRESWLAGWLVGSLAPEAISKMFNLRHIGISEASIQTEVLVLYIFFMRRESRILLCGIYYLLTYLLLSFVLVSRARDIQLFNYSTIHLFIYSSCLRALRLTRLRLEHFTFMEKKKYHHYLLTRSHRTEVLFVVYVR